MLGPFGHRFGDRALYIPPVSEDAVFQDVLRKADFISKVANQNSAAAKLDGAVSAIVPVLLGVSSPTTVPWFVIPRVVGISID
jgi:hypothetical protein